MVVRLFLLYRNSGLWIGVRRGERRPSLVLVSIESKTPHCVFNWNRLKRKTSRNVGAGYRRSGSEPSVLPLNLRRTFCTLALLQPHREINPLCLLRENTYRFSRWSVFPARGLVSSYIWILFELLTVSEVIVRFFL